VQQYAASPAVFDPAAGTSTTTVHRNPGRFSRDRSQDVPRLLADLSGGARAQPVHQQVEHPPGLLPLIHR